MTAFCLTIGFILLICYATIGRLERHIRRRDGLAALSLSNQATAMKGNPYA